MKYVVNPYLIYELEDENTTIIQTKDNSFATKNEVLVNFLRYMEENKIGNITFNDFMVIFKEENIANESIKFLMDSSIIKEENSTYLSSINDIVIFSNSSKVLELSRDIWKEDHEIRSLDEFKDQNYEDKLIIVCLDPFSLQKLKEIVSFINKDSTNVYKFVFAYNHSLYLSNYYSPRWGNPCPLCFFYSIESQLRGSQSGKNNLNFQVMVDLFYNEKGFFQYDGLLNKSDWLPVINQLHKEKKMSKANYSIIDDVLKIDLNDFSLSYDTCYFWEMCDCYE